MQWYYERDGQQVGPVSQAEMVRLIIHRHIQPHTLVWHPGFGDEWRPASRAGLPMLTPGAKVLFSTIGKPRSAPEGNGPAKAGPVGDLWAWLLLLPAVLDLTLLLAGQQTHWAVMPYRPATALCVLVILFFALAQDRRVLAQAGIRPPSFWWFLFPPGYYWCRSRGTGRGRNLFVIALLLFLVNNIAFLADPPPDVQSVLAGQMAGGKPAVSAPGKATDAPAARQPGPAGHGEEGHGASAPTGDGQVDL